MSAQTMDVFALRDAVVGEYKKFATSFTKIHAEDIRQQVEAIYAEERYWPEPLIQINANYRRGKTIDELVLAGTLDVTCGKVFRAGGEGLTLHLHQEQAIALAAEGASYVVTTGTGSGKSLCFFVPIVNAVLEERRKDTPRKTRAIIVYPMNALANSQLEELNKFLSNIDGEKPITCARYTGQERDEERQRIADNPPDILLTNFMMLELLMTRQEEVDRKVIGNCVGLRFLVLDELHTYRGRQGADVALLVRRVRERLSPEKLQCIGTSATMASEGKLSDKNRVVADVASKIFAAKIADSNVIVETLARVTDPKRDADSVRAQLGAAIDAGIAADISDKALRTHPLAIWVETRLGTTWSDRDQRLERARPMTVSEAVQQLSESAARPPLACRKALRELLLVSSTSEKERTGDDGGNPKSLFAFKLHQFFSGAQHAYCTLDAPGQRRVTVEGQQFLPGDPDKRLYAVHFCRECGHEYHPVRLTSSGSEKVFHARDIDDAPLPKTDDDKDESSDADDEEDEKEVFGFLTIHAGDAGFTFRDNVEDYPETWLDYDAGGNPRIKSHYRHSRARSVNVSPLGQMGTGVRAWFMPGKFRFCLRCGDTKGGAARDRNRLASLSGEGRSSATTVLVGSALRWMHGVQSGMDPSKRKLLGFTDNRQDAALQAGHFNDFLFVSLVRAGFLGALEIAGETGLRSDELGAAQQKALGFDGATKDARAEWSSDIDLRGFHLPGGGDNPPGGPGLPGLVRSAPRLAVHQPQPRAARARHGRLPRPEGPNGEDEELFAQSPDALRHARPKVREAVYREVFDHLRQSLAIRSRVLDPTVLEQMLSRSHSRLRLPWGFGTDEKPRRAGWLMISPPARRDRRDEDLIVRGGSRSGLGRTLRSTSLWDGNGAVRDLKSKAFDVLIAALLGAASKHGLVSEEVTPFENQLGWRLNDACVRFRKGTPVIDPAHPNAKAFFRDFYENVARLLRSPGHPMFGFEAREHTAHVDADKRVAREKRFRFGEKEREELAADEKHLREIGEANRFLPVLFCSPTMELGVDISALNAVYLRNVPPTPANYAQRSGRAGRSGQAALVLTYCAAQSPHDQYFFRDPRAMVHGEVRSPLLDLANRDLVESHLHAVWLACTEEPLDPAISELLVLGDQGRPLRKELRGRMIEPRVAREATERILRVLALVEAELTPEQAPWFPGRDAYATEIVQSAIKSFEDAFDRWRDLFVAAEQQRDAARRTMDDYSAPQHEKKAAQGLHIQAQEQLNLLQKGSSGNSTDFYTYRYLATEGFLPGYNFPRLPLMAFVPSTQDGHGRQTYLQRPRFLALSEFGPRSLVYHEGRAYRVVKALLAVERRDGATSDLKLQTKSVRICRSCGAAHFDDHASMCHGCGMSLGDAEIVKDTYRIEKCGHVARRAHHCKRRGEAAPGLRAADDVRVEGERWRFPDVRRGSASDVDGAIARLAYGPGARPSRASIRDRAVAHTRMYSGFKIDPRSGFWAKNEDEVEEPKAPTSSSPSGSSPACKTGRTRCSFSQAEWTSRSPRWQPCSTLFCVASRRLSSSKRKDPRRACRSATHGAAFSYEATEGGAGVLTRLVSESSTLARVARTALQIMHFKVEGVAGVSSDASALADVEGTACVAACYRCLMSYFNQPDHELLDRRDGPAREILLRLARAATTVERAPSAHPRPIPSDAAPDVARWLELSDRQGLPRPDAEALTVGDVRLPLVWRAHYVAVVRDAAEGAARGSLEGRGFEVVRFEGQEPMG